MNSKEIQEKYPDHKISESMFVKMKRQSIGKDYHEVIPLGWSIELEHSCDEWVIGGMEDAKSFLKDLERAISFIEHNPL